MSTKTIHYSRPYSFIGGESDPYFSSLEQNASSLGPYRQFLQATGVGHVLDVGANIGLTVALAHDLGAKSITAFEPSPRSFRYLAQNVRENRIEAVLHNLAVGAVEAELQFHDADYGAGAHVVSRETLFAPNSITVVSKPIDAFLSDLPKINALKMDIEGFELDGLAGAEQLLTRHRPSAFVEMNSFTLTAFANQNPRALIERMMALFPYVLSTRRGGGYMDVPNAENVRALLHRNIVENGGVDDLVGTFSIEVRDRLLAL